MEKENRAFLNSPVIQKNTPIKRLGLSRKRKSCGSGCSPVAKIQACDQKFSDSTTYSDKCHNVSKNMNYDEEIEKLKRKILEDEEKLKTLQHDKKNIKELEDLIELWKNGCRNAFLHFIQLLKDTQVENINHKTVLSKLGIWKIMFENFENDSELSLLD